MANTISLIHLVLLGLLLVEAAIAPCEGVPTSAAGRSTKRHKTHVTHHHRHHKPVPSSGAGEIKPAEININVLDEVTVQQVQKCFADRATMELCQRCASTAKTVDVFPLCCSDTDGVQGWCVEYLAFGSD